MNKKYFNDAFIGNKNITASFSKYGELLRLYYPAPDYRQYSDFFHVGLKVNDSNIIYLHKDVNNTYKQYYTENTNILNTEIDNSYFNLHIKQIDCVMIKRDVLIKKYIFTNNNSIDLNTNFIVHSKVISSYNNMAGGLLANDALVQYSHNFTCAILSKEPLLSHQLNDVERNILSGEVFDKDYIGMAPDAAISFDLGTIKPGESKEFTLVMYMTYDKTEINKIKEDVTELRRINTDKEIEKIEEYWKKFVEKHDKYKILSRRKYSPKFKEIYKRTILFMDLLINHETGGVAASLEVDEERDKCHWLRPRSRRLACRRADCGTRVSFAATPRNPVVDICPLGDVDIHAMGRRRRSRCSQSVVARYCFGEYNRLRSQFLRLCLPSAAPWHGGHGCPRDALHGYNIHFQCFQYILR